MISSFSASSTAAGRVARVRIDMFVSLLGQHRLAIAFKASTSARCAECGGRIEQGDYYTTTMISGKLSKVCSACHPFHQVVGLKDLTPVSHHTEPIHLTRDELAEIPTRKLAAVKAPGSAPRVGQVRTDPIDRQALASAIQQVLRAIKSR